MHVDALLGIPGAMSLPSEQVVVMGSGIASMRLQGHREHVCATSLPQRDTVGFGRIVSDTGA